jgi:hypothetical protein
MTDLMCACVCVSVCVYRVAGPPETALCDGARFVVTLAHLRTCK